MTKSPHNTDVSSRSHLFSVLRDLTVRIDLCRFPYVTREEAGYPETSTILPPTWMEAGTTWTYEDLHRNISVPTAISWQS